jgi:hypothetical protein
MNAAAHREYLKILAAEIADGEDRLADLRRKGEEIWQQYAELQAELEESRRVIRSVALRAGEDPSNYAPSGVALPRGIPASRPRPCFDVIMQVLREAGRPLKVQAIVEAVGAAGYSLPDDPKSQYSVVYTALRRRKGRDFVKNKRGAYSLLNGRVAP